MFEGLKKAFQKLSNTIKDKVEYKELKEDDVEEVLEDLKLDMIENDVAFDVAENIIENVKKELIGYKVKRGESVEDVIKDSLKNSIMKLMEYENNDIITKIKNKCSKNEPFVIVFLGINGVGKTTTIAKFSNVLKKNNISVVIAGADTFRAGAQEQIDVHAKRLDIPIIKGQYGGDPASVAYNAILYAKSRGICTVLIDTAGRMHSDVDLMEELKKIIRVTKPDMKVLVVDALTGNDAVEQARLFNDNIGIDAIIITKIDADVKGGVAISVSSITKKPIIYLGYGQSYEDLKKFDPKEYVNNLFD
ncbi:signal recognition particle-docking protein FtsY [Caldisphaera lagunensis DSM 15908]|uniref:Signal recognition particle receptor FtsY n=1 Tax=Caldisphaera lagunensis (strain DSM 15908 / JCM 11604 / ANMR 0165 / IC-154) TaxID=1056495 RepID=L0ACN1_CALLD|nr:signal recognition particle-docking protein FtsY [Caldisphaera lagunensis]AFZ71184.1 signal recognition particle-docking protein FtsY [Caldisphaera lagunensis DSM 15908]